MHQEKKTSFLPRHWASVILVGLAGACIGLGVVLRSIWLSWPNKYVFDEVYFPHMAAAFLNRQVIFDAHPPFGKYLIAIGIWVMGNNTYGWRIIPLLGGFTLVMVAGFLAKRIASNSGEKDTAMIGAATVAGICMAVAVALDGHFIVYSRLGLMDGLLVLFMLLAYWSAWRGKTPTHMVITAVLLGLCLAIKWPAAALFPVVWFISWRKHKNELLRALASLPISVGVYCLVIISAAYIEGSNPYTYFIWWHTSVWNYQLTLTEGHPWGSVWWTWPLMLKPVLFLRDTQADGSIRAIMALPNLISWWGSGLVVLGTIGWYLRELLRGGGKKVLDHPTLPLILAWAASWLPWAAVHRVLFMYHYLPAYIFALLVSSYWCGVLWKKKPWLVIVLLISLAVCTLYFARVLIAIPTAPEWFTHNKVLPSWIY